MFDDFKINDNSKVCRLEQEGKFDLCEAAEILFKLTLTMRKKETLLPTNIE